MAFTSIFNLYEEQLSEYKPLLTKCQNIKHSNYSNEILLKLVFRVYTDGDKPFLNIHDILQKYKHQSVGIYFIISTPNPILVNESILLTDENIELITACYNKIYQFYFVQTSTLLEIFDKDYICYI